MRGWGTGKNFLVKPKMPLAPTAKFEQILMFFSIKYSFLCSFELNFSQNCEKSKAKFLKFSLSKLNGGGEQYLVKKQGQQSVGG